MTHRVIFYCPDYGKIKLFITVGMDDDKQPSELFITADQSGSTLDGFCDAWSIAMSLCLQHGVKLKTLADKFEFTEFSPGGITDNERIPMAKSIPDYVVRWMAMEFNK